MRIKVTYFGQIKAAVGRGTEEVEVEEATTARELVRVLARRHGGDARRMLLDDADEVQRGLLVVVNDEQALPHDTSSLADGDRVTLMPPISGGAGKIERCRDD